jgi:type VI protein secretion system component VasF
MRSSFAKLRWAGACVALLLAVSWTGLHSLSASQVQSQSPQLPPVQPAPPPIFGEPPSPSDPMERQRQEKLAKARNVDRQKQLVQDTNKLLSLAKELKDEVDKSNSDTLSLDVVKKASEIEKLAKSVKDRMKG